MLTFISFWRAAAIVLNDLASSAYYAGGESESFIGKSAPWFILGVMLFSYCVRAIYVESCSMFVRGAFIASLRGAGRNSCKIFRFRIDVRLRPDRPDQRRFGRAIPGRAF